MLPAQALIIGTAAYYPPFSSLSTIQNQFTGFEIDIMQDVCKRIKTSCNFISVDVSQITSELIAQKIDLGMAAIIILDKPVDGFLLSIPYLPSSAQFLAEKTSKINSPADIKDKTIGVRRGTLMGGNMFRDIVLNLYGGKVQVIEYPQMEDLLTALNNKDIDAIFTNAAAADYWLLNGGGLYKLIGRKIPVGYGYGVMANLGQEKLIEKINQALRSMMADGRYATIYSRYF